MSENRSLRRRKQFTKYEFHCLDWSLGRNVMTDSISCCRQLISSVNRSRDRADTWTNLVGGKGIQRMLWRAHGLGFTMRVKLCDKIGTHSAVSGHG